MKALLKVPFIIANMKRRIYEMRKVLRKLMPAILSISMVASSAFMPLSSMTVNAADPEQSVNADLSGGGGRRF